MTKKTTEQLQKEYDEMIITIDRLKNAVNQSTHVFDWFTAEAEKAKTDEEKIEMLR